MSNWWESFKAYFKEPEPIQPNGLISREMLTRPEGFDDDFQTWQEGIVYRRIKDWMFNQYALFKVNPDQTDEAIDFHIQDASRGILIYFFHTQYSARETTFLLEALAGQVRSSRYRLQMSDVRIFNRPSRVERVERMYLKPKWKFEEDTLLDQQFGNITLELIFHNDQPHLLKLLATAYHDRKYTEPATFDQLVQLLAE